MEHLRINEGRLEKLVFARHIWKDGKIYFPKKAKVFCFWVPVK